MTLAQLEEPVAWTDAELLECCAAVPEAPDVATFGQEGRRPRHPKRLRLQHARHLPGEEDFRRAAFGA